MAIGILEKLYPAETDKLTNKVLKEVSAEEVKFFNMDLLALASQYAAEPVRAAIEKYQKEMFLLARNVMYSAKQPYGGANALGNEITMRLLRPVDLAFTIEEYWDLDLSGSAVGNVWGYQTGGVTPADDTIGEEEGNIIFGWTDPVPLPGFAAYQLVSNVTRSYGYYTVSFAQCRADSIPFMELQAPIIEWPEDTVRINMVVARLINPTRMQAIGIHFARARSISTATGSA